MDKLRQSITQLIQVSFCVIPLNGYADQFVPIPFMDRYFYAIFVVKTVLESYDIDIRWEWGGEHLTEPGIG